jgi:Ca2+-binding RTX toxin-like protein
MPTITGTAGADTLTGTGQAELIEGLGGDDVIGGGGGADTILGGAGNDRIVFQLSTNPPTQVDGGSGVDILDFSAYDSSRFFYNQPLFIRSGATPDTLSVSAYFFERGGVGTTPVVLARGQMLILSAPVSDEELRAMFQWV